MTERIATKTQLAPYRDLEDRLEPRMDEPSLARRSTARSSGPTSVNSASARMAANLGLESVVRIDDLLEC